MDIRIDKRFQKDLRKLKDPKLSKEVLNLIQKVEGVKSLEGLKKLKGFESYYRIRIGLELEGNTLSFIRCLHRKDIYQFFPK